MGRAPRKPETLVETAYRTRSKIALLICEV
jgi:hypothetical protein